MVGLVIVSHSGKIAEGIRELALQVADTTGQIIAAGGMEDGTIPPDEHPKYLGIVADESRRLSKLIDDLLGAPDAGWDERMYAYNESLFRQVKAFYAVGTEKRADAGPVRPLADYAGDYLAPGYRRFRMEWDGSALTADFNTFRTGLRSTGENRFATLDVIGELPAGLELTFGTDDGGNIRTLTVLLGSEKDLKPIVFTKDE